MKVGVSKDAVCMTRMKGIMVFGLPTAPVGVGPGIAGSTSWLVTAVVLVLLAVLAWWTMRPGRRATHAEVRRSRQRSAERAESDTSGAVETPTETALTTRRPPTQAPHEVHEVDEKSR